jgi:hypothetical protein
MTKPVNYIVEMGIGQLFDAVSHYWQKCCFAERIADCNLLWLVSRFLRAGVMADSEVITTTLVTLQGGCIISPLLANLYYTTCWICGVTRDSQHQAKGYIENI